MKLIYLMMLFVLSYLSFFSIYISAQDINTPEHFPDPNFRAVVEKKMEVKPGEPFTADKAVVKTGYLDCRNLKIRSIAGIEFFPKIEILLLEDNLITQVDLSHNPSLLELTLGTNQLTSLDCSHNPHLRRLECQDNHLKTLILPNTTALMQLNCNINQLETLDVSHLPNLQLLNCAANRLTILDVSQNQVLNTLDCSRNRLTELDLSNNRYLDYLHCQWNQIKRLDLTHQVLSFLKCVGNPLYGFYVSTSHKVNLRGYVVNSQEPFPYDVPHNSELSWPESQSLPVWVHNAFAKHVLSATYAMSSEMNPFYLRGDFNGDRQPDLAVYVIEIATGKNGIALFHKNTEECYILGAGNPFNNSDHFGNMDVWYVYDQGEVHQGMDEGPPPAIMGDAVMVVWTETSSGLIYWDGKEYKWYQQGD